MSNEVRHCGTCGGTIAKDTGETSNGRRLHTYCLASKISHEKKVAGTERNNLIELLKLIDTSAGGVTYEARDTDSLRESVRLRCVELMEIERKFNRREFEERRNKQATVAAI